MIWGENPYFRKHPYIFRLIINPPQTKKPFPPPWLRLTFSSWPRPSPRSRCNLESWFCNFTASFHRRCASKLGFCQRRMEDGILTPHLDVSENSGFSPQIIHLFIGFSILNHPFWGTPIFGNTHWINHQPVQVPKMEGFLNLILGYFGGWVFPYISRIHTAYIGAYLHFRYMKCLVN